MIPARSSAASAGSAGRGTFSGCPAAEMSGVLIRGVEKLTEPLGGVSGVGEVGGGGRPGVSDQQPTESHAGTLPDRGHLQRASMTVVRQTLRYSTTQPEHGRPLVRLRPTRSCQEGGSSLRGSPTPQSPYRQTRTDTNGGVTGKRSNAGDNFSPTGGHHRTQAAARSTRNRRRHSKPRQSARPAHQRTRAAYLDLRPVRPALIPCTPRAEAARPVC